MADDTRALVSRGLLGISGRPPNLRPAGSGERPRPKDRPLIIGDASAAGVLLPDEARGDGLHTPNRSS